jgi:hypothetical protein
MPSTILSDNGASSGTAGLKSTGSNDGQLVLQTTTAGGAATTAMTINTSQAVTFAQTANLPNTFGFKNRIINGGMVIDQRNAGASVTPTGNTYTLDRWFAGLNVASKFSVQRSTTAPTGFINSVLITSTSAYSVLSADRFAFSQFIEGFNTADLAWGTASAKTVTLSFWVRSSLTGTFGGALQNNASDRSYPFTFTINAANTFEYKTVTIAGDTTGTWLTDNQIGIGVRFSLGTGTTYSGTAGAWAGADYRSATGAVSLVGTNGATLYITGVQLEAGSTATSFDYRDYGRELIMCQRYFFAVTSATDNPVSVGYTTTAINFLTTLRYPVVMRVAPAISSNLIAGDKFRANGASTDSNSANNFVLDAASPAAIEMFNNGFSGLTVGGSFKVRQFTATGVFGLTAEL